MQIYITVLSSLILWAEYNIMLIFSYTVSLATKMDKIQTFFSCINYTKNTPNTDAEDKEIRSCGLWCIIIN